MTPYHYPRDSTTLEVPHESPLPTSVAVAASLIVSVPSAATTIHVPSQEPTIQASITAASAGDTVLVACDTY